MEHIHSRQSIIYKKSMMKLPIFMVRETLDAPCSASDLPEGQVLESQFVLLPPRI